MCPDPATLRRTPWHPGTAQLDADLLWHDGSPVAASPRQILRRRLDRLAEHGRPAHAATELEFILFRDNYAAGWDRAYRGLTPADRYNVEHSVLGTGRVEGRPGAGRPHVCAAGHAHRFENRLPGGDVSPHLAVAAMIAVGLHGIEHELEPGDAYTGDAPHVPGTPGGAAEPWGSSTIAEHAFGAEVVAHHLHTAQVEQDAYDTAVTDRERFRSFERM